MESSQHGQWSSRLAFILAASGAAVGLGNIWKFPYIAGENGGGAFVLIYLFCIAIMGVPIMVAEIMIGRSGRLNPAGTMKYIAQSSGKKTLWGLAGGITVLAGFLILTYYSVIAGWAADYVVLAIQGSFTNANADQISQTFTQLISNPWRLTLWHTVIIGTTGIVVALGVERGLERSIRYLFPTMILLLFIVIIYSISTGYFGHGLSFLFKPNFQAITQAGVLSALGHAFFTLSLATGSIMMYGAYVPKDVSIPVAAFYIALADTVIALMAGLAIFPIVFAYHLEPGAGPGLIFQTLPLAFGQMPFGTLLATVFFLMLVFAAFTSAISLLEPSVAWLIENYKIKRKYAAMIACFGIWLLGFTTIFSFNLWSEYRCFERNFFDLIDHVTANIMLPVGGMLIAIFAAWVMDQKMVADEINHKHGPIYKVWRFTLGYISPIGITLVFLNSIGIFG